MKPRFILLLALGVASFGNAAVESDEVSDLPLIEVPSHEAGGNALAILISGDGGWAHTDKVLSAALAEHGVPVVGLNALHYFWKRRSPEESAVALERIVRHYTEAWQRQQVVLIGFSRGAVVLPFMASRLPADLRGRVRLIALLSPGQMATFQFHLADWLGVDSDTDGVPVPPEIQKLAGTELLCFYGEDDSDAKSLCTGLAPGLAKQYPQKGGHHFEESYDKVAGLVLQELHGDAGGQIQ
jgi:type IV secretory pathway VirJ component